MLEEKKLYTQELTQELRECFPQSGPIHAYMTYAHKTTHAPPILHLGAILPIAANDIIRHGFWREGNRPLHIWSLLVGSTGAGKSFAYQQAINFAKRVQSEQGLTVDEFIGAEGSVPGLLEVMSQRFDESQQCTHGVLVHDEYARVVGQESAAQALCKLFDGNDYERHLRHLQKAKAEGGDVKSLIRKPWVSGIFASTPSALERVTDASHFEGGLMSRILWFRAPQLRADQLMPDSRRNDAELKRALEEWRGWLGYMSSVVALGGDDRLAVTYSDEALMIRSEHFEMNREKLAEADERLAGTMLRLNDYMLRIATLYAVSEGLSEVGVESMQQAIALTTLCLEYATVLGEQLGVNDHQKGVSKLVEYIKTAGPDGRTRTDITRAFRGYSKAEMEMFIESAQSALDIFKTDPKSTGGRPTTRFHAIKFRSEVLGK